MSSLAGSNPTPFSADKLHQGNCLQEFSPVSAEEVKRLLSSMLSKSSPLDAVPMSLLKAFRDAFSPVIARLANLIFQYGTFPFKFKSAQITPLLKRPDLDSTNPSSYRPISNLNIISKNLERLILARVMQHINSSGNIDHFQSAYRSGHSTETALLKVTSDIFEAFDRK
jgi:hypothetical protein